MTQLGICGVWVHHPSRDERKVEHELGREMVVTRSRLDTQLAAKPKKIKFNDDDTINESEYNTAEENETVNDEPNGSESSASESDSDEAPEEESTSTAKSALIDEQRRQKALRRQVMEEQKHLRRLQDQHNKQQQELKRSRSQTEKQIELPEFLPDDIMTDIQTLGVNDEYTEKKNTYKKFDDEKDIRALKIEKLKALKKSRSAAIQKGPVRVQVHTTINKKQVPMAERKIVGSRDKWLHRKSLNRK